MVMVRERNNEELRAQLIEKAQSTGSISYDDILAVLPNAERNVAQLDDLMDELLEAGIDVLPGKDNENQNLKEGSNDFDEDEEIFASDEDNEDDEDDDDWLLLDRDLVNDVVTSRPSIPMMSLAST